MIEPLEIILNEDMRKGLIKFLSFFLAHFIHGVAFFPQSMNWLAVEPLQCIWNLNSRPKLIRADEKPKRFKLKEREQRYEKRQNTKAQKAKIHLKNKKNPNKIQKRQQPNDDFDHPDAKDGTKNQNKW